MKKILLPNGLEVSEVALGAMMFGTTTSKQDSYRTLDLFMDMGGNFIDTSNNYAHWAGTGDESETLLGEWLKDRGCRDRVVLATKVGFDRHGKGAGLKKEQIEYWIDESLRKLGTDYIDLYYAHTDDPNTPLEETMEAFDRLVKKGKVRTLGASNYDTWRLSEANVIASSKEMIRSRPARISSAYNSTRERQTLSNVCSVSVSLAVSLILMITAVMRSFRSAT